MFIFRIHTKEGKVRFINPNDGTNGYFVHYEDAKTHIQEGDNIHWYLHFKDKGPVPTKKPNVGKYQILTTGDWFKFTGTGYQYFDTIEDAQKYCLAGEEVIER